ncbi:MAG TPA: dienelactone hydrolase family protein [Tepidisphaeraceae bacterium]|jgi:dienelactone hydrolase|nr:dienelactone hydrolase family protein [Tepidisphaeraceae bacterium]
MKKLTLTALAILLSPITTLAAIRTETVEYKHGDQTLKGFVAYDDAVTGKRPGVLVAPEWWGLTDYPKKRAQQLAELGYVAFVADYYGDGKTTDDPKEAGEMAGPVKNDPEKLRALGNAALDQLKARPEVDPSKLAAIGYCFGGSAVLELARDGSDLKGVVSFHGGLSTTAPAGPGDVKTIVLVAHGIDDPMVSIEEVAAFHNEMKQANATYEIHAYSGAVHAFTNPDADAKNIPGIKYNARADERSWDAMRTFFADLFK